MAKQTKTILIDDLNGLPADETVKFGLDGVVYEIDLTTENAKRLRQQVRVWAAAGTRVGGRRKMGTPRGTTKSSEIREWARSKGLTVPDRGRIPVKVCQAYYEEHPKDKQEN